MRTQEANWYKPAPGEPYIPRLAFPTKLKALDPLWTRCEPGPFFTAFDPPRTLVPVSAIAPDTTVNRPSTTWDPRSEGSTSAAGRTPAPVSTPELNQPKQTATQVVDSGELNGHSSTQRHVPTQGSSPVDGSGNHEESVIIPDSAQPQIVKSKSPGDDPGAGVHHSDPLAIEAQTETQWPSIPLHSINNPTLSSASHRLPVIPSGQPSDIATVAGEAATLLPGIVAIGSTTLARGDPPITISGTVISLGLTALVVMSKTLPLPQSQQVMTDIDGNTLTFVPNAVAIAGTTLTPGGSPATISGTIISVGSSALLVAPTPLPLPYSQQTVPNLASNPATLLSNAVIIAGKTLQAGDTLTLSGMEMSISSSFVVMGFRTINFRQSQHVTALNGNALITGTERTDQNGGTALDGTSFHGTPVSLASNGDLFIGDTSLKPGGTAVKIKGTPVSLAPDGNLVVSHMTLKPGGAGIMMHGTPISVAADGDLVVDGTTLEPGAAGMTMDGASAVLMADRHLVVDGATLKPGDAGMTVHGLQVSLAPDGDLVLNGTTLKPGGADMTLGGMPVSLAPQGDIIVSDTTLGPEDTGITVNGIPMSIAPDGDLIIGTSTEPTTGLGPLIVGAFGSGPTGSSIASNSSVLAFEGAAGKSLLISRRGVVVLVCVMMVVGIT